MTAEIPLFPLGTVLFPGGVLPLKIFEPRYMRMAAGSLRAGSPFGVVLIARGHEVGQPAEPHAVGCSARISDWDMTQLGVLHITARGERRFRVVTHRADADGLLLGAVEWLAPEAPQPLPESLQDLVPLTEAIVRDLGPERMPEPHRYDDPAWVGHRLCEVLPIPLAARQKLLELDDAISRLEIIRSYLSDKGVLG